MTERNLALPTETWREYIERRKRCIKLREKLAAGEIQSINDFVTLNLDIEQFAEDVIVNSEGPELVRAFWKALIRISISRSHLRVRRFSSSPRLTSSNRSITPASTAMAGLPRRP